MRIVVGSLVGLLSVGCHTGTYLFHAVPVDSARGNHLYLDEPWERDGTKISVVGGPQAGAMVESVKVECQPAHACEVWNEEYIKVDRSLELKEPITVTVRAPGYEAVSFPFVVPKEEWAVVVVFLEPVEPSTIQKAVGP